MQGERLTAAHTSSRLIWIPIVLLVGVLMIGAGYFQQRTVLLYVGVCVTLAGVLSAIVRLVTRGTL
jgi:hypothetical protein